MLFMIKKILVLGTGPAQVDLILAAKEMDMQVFACGHDETSPGAALVDEFSIIDIKDVKKIIKYAAEKEVDFVYTMALESAIPTIVEVSESLDLPTFTNSDTMKMLNNKTTWRKKLGDIEGNVKSLSLRTLQDLENWEHYPAIIKPVDSSGQRGVYKVENKEQVLDFFDASISHSASKELIIEQYITGPEISVNAMMHKGKLDFALISDRISYTEYPGGIIKEHHIPSRIMKQATEEKIYKLVENVNKIMGLNDGHIYFQLKVEEGEPYIIEFTPRFDGCHMWRLVYESTGIDLRKASLELLSYGSSEELAKTNDPYKIKPRKTKFISDKPGTIVDKANYNLPEDLLFIEWYYKNGDKVKSVTGYFEKLGYYIVEE